MLLVFQPLVKWKHSSGYRRGGSVLQSFLCAGDWMKVMAKYIQVAVEILIHFDKETVTIWLMIIIRTVSVLISLLSGHVDQKMKTSTRMLHANMIKSQPVGEQTMKFFEKALKQASKMIKFLICRYTQ